MTDFVSIQTRGTISIPPALRRRYGLDEPGAQMEIIDAGDHIVLRPKLAVDSSQAWFWSADWQAGERDAEAQRRGGEGTVHESGEELLGALESKG
jgi:bifunctional DNA-binding transcriptional regulator/antitoxin component of YhaV-PrlF toxin-antitoxin module